jgi:hypothetical protein
MISGHADAHWHVPRCKTSVGGAVLARSQCATGVSRSSSMNSWMIATISGIEPNVSECAYRQPMHCVRLQREIPVFGFDDIG